MADAASEQAQRAALGRLFEAGTLQDWLAHSWTALGRLRQPDGGMAWLEGGPSDQTSSARVLTELQQALGLPGLDSSLRDSLRGLILPLVRYLDERLHRQLASMAGPYEAGPLLGSLYAASAAWSWAPADSLTTDRASLLGLLEGTWKSLSFADQAACALVMQRLGASAEARQVLASLRQTALLDGGMHWLQPGSRGSEDPLFDQSLMLEAFLNLGGTASEERSMQDWLIGQKQGLRWQGSPGTLAAVSALVERQSSWLSRVPELRLRLGDTSLLLPGQGQVDPLRRWRLPESLWAGRSADTPVLELTGAGPEAPGWVSLFVRYQAPLQDLAAGGTGLEVRRRLELDTGAPLGAGAVLAPGMPLRVVLDIRSSRDLDYVVLSDQPGSLLGLPYQTSGWNASGGIGYYRARQGTRSLFYIRHLPKGHFQISYPAYIERRGTGLSGVAELHCMYAPALQAHSAGARLRVP